MNINTPNPNLKPQETFEKTTITISIKDRAEEEIGIETEDEKQIFYINQLDTYEKDKGTKEKIMRINLVYFSPSGTGRKTLKNIANGMPEGIELREIDLTKPSNRKIMWKFKEDELVLFATLTASNILGPNKEIFGCLEGNDTPVVPIAMFGNGFYGNGLITEKNNLEKKGFKTVAAGAFIGQHACNPNMANGRPDDRDRKVAADFGAKIYDKVAVKKDLTFNHKLKIDCPSKEEGVLTLVKCAVLALKGGTGLEAAPKPLRGIGVDHDKCIMCKACVNKCPKEALSVVEDKIVWDIDRCISCYGCVNICPTQAVHGTNKAFIRLFEKAEGKRTLRREPEITI